MRRDVRPTYTETELQSFLPTGWSLVSGGEGTWDEKRKTYTFRVLDNVDFDWPVRISGGEVSELGRLGALGRALEEVDRARLGRHTRGLGLAG